MSRLSLALMLLIGCAAIAALVSSGSPSTASSLAIRDAAMNQKDAARLPQAAKEPADVAAFRQSVGGDITAVIVELKGEPGVLLKVAAERKGQRMAAQELAEYGLGLYAKQEEFRSSLAGRSVRALMRETDVRQIDGSVRHIEYRFTYLLNGFVAYVATEDIPRLRALPEVTHVEKIRPVNFHLDKAIDYILGTQSDTALRRTAVYGATKEVETGGKQFQPAGSLCPPAPAVCTETHPETPQTPAQKINGFEGQGMNIAVIDTGVDWRHPMFGGTGNGLVDVNNDGVPDPQPTPQPRVSGQPESPADNKKVIYYYALSSPGDLTDDFGHGTHVASCAAGYGVDGSTPRRTGYGTGTTNANGTTGTGIGPTPNGVFLFGTAPQARIMAYKVCGPANACAGDTELAMEDAASPFTLVASGDPGPTPVAKPVADVINLSLGDTAGDPAGSSARAANNAALAGTIVVASAGNAGPGAATTGAPSVATLAIAVAATLDPGSLPAGDVLAPNQISLETCAGQSTCAVPGPPPEQGAISNANTPQPGERQGIRLFPVAGGGPLPEGSLSAHYVYVEDPNTTPTHVRNRIALVRGGTGAFANIVNAVAAHQPAAIIITDDRESLTAVVVAGNIPVFNVNNETTNYLINRLSDSDADGNGDGRDDAAVGTVSQFPLRIAESVTLPTFVPGMAGFSSRGPNDFDARFRTIKPDIAAPGVGVMGAATAEGLPEETVGMASLTGYISVNGTSFSGPITAGAMAVVRQRVREELGLDSVITTPGVIPPNFTTRRFDTVTVARALLQNTATNLRSGLGVAQGDGTASVAAINDMGSGLVNLAGALDAKAIMVSPTELLLTPSEFTPQPAPSPQPSPTPFFVLLPTASFGNVPVVGVNGTVTRTHEVIVRDVTGGAGSGAYTLSFQNNRFADHPGFQISFTAADGTTPATSVTVPAGGQASFFVKVVGDGEQIAADPTEFQWYVTATHNSSSRKLRMPFFYRAVRATFPGIEAPTQQDPGGVEQPAPSPPPSCPVDTNGNYQVRWTYDGDPEHVGFRVQEATRSDEVFFDNADEPLVAGANSKWAGSEQWTSQVNPDTGSLAYFIPDTAEQNESLTTIDPITLPAGGATLSFVTMQDTELDFDFAHVEISTDAANNFINFTTIATFSGFFSGTRFLDISPYAGQQVKLRFRMTSDLAVPAPGWWVEDIRVNSDDFHTIADTGPAITSFDITGKGNGTFSYRIAALFNNPNASEAGTTIVGPYSNVKCVTVSGATPSPSPSVSPSPSPSPTATPTPTAVFTFGSPTVVSNEDCTAVVVTVNRAGATNTRATVDVSSNDGSAKQKGDYTVVVGRLIFEAGQTQKTIQVLINEDGYSEGTESATLVLQNPQNGALGVPDTATLRIIDDAPETSTNPIDDSRAFVCQHYHDFLYRHSDPSGEDFWTNNIEACGADAQCRQVFRVNVSQAFFLSIEFEETGYLVVRAHKAAFGSAKSNPRYLVFLRDQKQINEGLIVGQGNWQQQLETNKQNYLTEFVSRPDFVSQFPQGQPAAQYVDQLFANASATPTTAERNAAIASYGSGDTAGRAAALRSVIESGSVFNAQYNLAAVLMQYFGYLRRNPDDSPDNNFIGYDFWLNKLNSFSQPGEDMRNDQQAQARLTRAEMVRAFIESVEYRQRFFGSASGNQEGSSVESTASTSQPWWRNGMLGRVLQQIGV